MSVSLSDARKRRGQTVQAEKKRKKPCQSGLTTCKIKIGKKKTTLCVDAQTDPANCGGCGYVCAASQACQGGVCTCNGAPCTGCCDGKTCQAGTSQQQCGVYGAVCQACTGGRSCQNGVCTCPAGQTFCGGVCIDPKADNTNRGTCETICTLPRTCGGGGVPNVRGCVPEDSVTTHRDFCCTSSCCRDELPAGQCRCARGCG